MKLSNEVKVGMLAVVAMGVMFFGFSYVKGRGLFSKSYPKIYAVFTDFGTLSTSSEVKINGYVIGDVSEIHPLNKELNGFVATIRLKEDVNIPADSKAFISSPLVGSSYVIIEKGSALTLVKPGDTLLTIPGEIRPQLTPIEGSIKELIDSLTNKLKKFHEDSTTEKADKP
jgi:phospholipid/cholesterol/gamma-HCH transport system substrate-binding protein